MTTNAVLVCVTGQKNCARLIARGKEAAALHGLPLLVLSVAGSGKNLLVNPDVADALDFLYQQSADAGAEMNVLCSDKPLDTIVDFARSHHVTHLIVGAGKPDCNGESFSEKLSMALPKVTFHTDTGI